MLDISNIVVDSVTVTDDPGTLQYGNSKEARVKKLKGLLDIKCASYLRLCATKNVVNRASDYHYLNLCVAASTAPVNDIDYIHPVVKPTVDYSTAVISKGLAPNGEISFEFVAQNDQDGPASRQATDMVSAIFNSFNDPHKVLHEWVMDAALHKNGMMLVQPVREKVTLYRETQGTMDQLKAYEVRAEEMGVKCQRQSRRKVGVDAKRVMAETQQFVKDQTQDVRQQALQTHLDNIQGQAEALASDDDTDFEPQQIVDPMAVADDQEAALQDAINRNTIYKAKYKLTGYNLNIKLRHIAQHYWICDPNVTDIQEMPFCGFYDPMSIQEVTELYPDIDLEEFRRHAEYNQNGAYQAGSVLNNLAIHSRDSVPTMGLPVNSAASQDEDARQVTILTCWDRFDIDDDGELELIEIICSGAYIISAREVEYIPVANMNPKPLPGNFFGMSIAESVVPMQEYMTSAHRAEIQLGLLQATTRIGVKPDRVDFEMMMDGEAAIFVLDSKFDPATDVYSIPPPNGNIQFLSDSMDRMNQDKMAMIGMTQPQDVFNPEVMAPGNSGIKLQMALSPNQLIQDDTVKNCAQGLKEAIWLVWRTLIQYGDDYGVKKLAAKFAPNDTHKFLDYQSFDDLDFCERKEIHVDLAMGMSSEENAMARIQIIKQAQQEMYATIQAMAPQNFITPESLPRIRKPYDDMLFTVGVKDPATYLPTDEEIMAIVKAAQQPAPATVKQLTP